MGTWISLFQARTRPTTEPTFSRIPTAIDWDHDGLPDIVTNSIWGKIEWFKNVGTRSEPKLASAQLVKIDWFTS